MSVEEAEALAADTQLLENIDVRYIMSHLACADEADDVHNDLQAEQMQRIADIFPGIPVSFGKCNGTQQRVDALLYAVQLINITHCL